MDVEVEYLPGMAPFVVDELGGRFPLERVERDAARIAALDLASVRELLGLRTAVAVHLVRRFDVPRPKALLGHQHLTALAALLGDAQRLSAFSSFRVSAAGSDSSVFARLRDAVAEATGLVHDERDGELLVRVRRDGAGWEVTARTTPRPLATRPWRRRDFRGALNATIAAAMVRSTPGDRALNLMAGSGTLLAERSDPSVGIDHDRAVLALAVENAPAAALVAGDARCTPFADASFDALTADLPYGQAIGSHAENDALYRDVLDEAARIAMPGTRFAVVTHDIRRFRGALASQHAWRAEWERQVFQKGHHPFVWLLVRD